MNLRALLVDDEQPARERLRRLLASHGEIEIVGEASDGREAIEKVLEIRPDIVFLDIQMPGCTGLEVVASLPAPRPRVIFCTAYDHYAVDAFELRALDYLLKPINRARLDEALARLEAGGAPDLDSAQAPPAEGWSGYPARFLARRSSRYHVVPREDALYLATEEGITRLQTKQHHYWMQPSLSELERRLDPARFCRVSRGAIVNLDAVREVHPAPGGGGVAHLSDGTRLEVSRRRFRTLLDRLSGL